MKILLILWQLPQSIVFWCIYLFLLARKEVHGIDTRVEPGEKTTLFHTNEFLTCCGLGEFLIFDERDLVKDDKTFYHELGHCKQSLYLGWFYLLVVGLPSLALNLFSRKNETIRENYYSYFPENWADKLGGVDR